MGVFNRHKATMRDGGPAEHCRSVLRHSACVKVVMLTYTIACSPKKTIQEWGGGGLLKNPTIAIENF